jgi:hypothetical protein
MLAELPAPVAGRVYGQRSDDPMLETSKPPYRAGATARELI